MKMHGWRWRERKRTVEQICAENILSLKKHTHLLPYHIFPVVLCMPESKSPCLQKHLAGRGPHA